jgi:Holliday junction resolvase
MTKEIYIVKADGGREPFSEAKLRRSLQRTSASQGLIEDIIIDIKAELRDGMSTSTIYRRAFSLLRQRQTHAAGRYSLKKAIMKLGPSGHPFERLVGELLKSEGYKVEVGVTLQGLCVTHEVDVIGKKDNQCIMVECKFHNEPGIKSDVKVALYIRARFEDLQNRWKQKPGTSQKFDEAWLVTNTKLTSDAIRYASCVGMKAIGWSYPRKKSLQILVEQSGLHPITSLTTLSESFQRQLIEQGIITCKELAENRSLLQTLKIGDAKITRILNEINALCKKSVKPPVK